MIYLTTMNTHWKDWCWSWSSNILATWFEELTHLKRPWWWERLKVGGEGNNRESDGWMVSPTQWTWIWASSCWWWTGSPAVLQSMGSQRVRHNWVTELNWMYPIFFFPLWFMLFVSYLRNLCLNQDHKDSILGFILEILCLLHPGLWSISWLIFVYGVR